MKKSLVLAMAMALGVTASAYAANPFSDVPAGHWAYDAVNELAAAGVVEGYGDGTYAGDKLITRYEMAQIVAKAMAKGADCDKLAAEFASELDTLGVRVAALEKKADNVKITGQIRYEWKQTENAAGTKSTDLNRLRTRLFLNGKINEDWSYGARLQNDQKFNNAAGDDELKLNRAYVSGKVGGLKVTAGRVGQVVAEGLVYDESADGIQVSYGSKVKVSGYYAQPTQGSFAGVMGPIDVTIAAEEVYGAAISAKLGGIKTTVEYAAFKNNEATASDLVVADLGKNEIYAVTGKYSIGNVGLSATYLKSDAEMKDFGASEEDDGVVVGLTYKGAKGSQVGSWGAYANYYNQPGMTAYAHTFNGAPTDSMKLSGFEGYMVGTNYTVAKNMVAMVEYYDLEGQEGDSSEAKTIFTRLQFSF